MNDFLVSTHALVLPLPQPSLLYLREWHHHYPCRQRPKSPLWHFLLPESVSNLLPNLSILSLNIPSINLSSSLSQHLSPEALITSCLKYCSSFLIGLPLSTAGPSNQFFTLQETQTWQETPQTHAYVLSLASTHLYNKDKVAQHGRPCVVWPWSSLLLYTYLASFCSLHPNYSAPLLFLPVPLPLASQGLCSNCPLTILP